MLSILLASAIVINSVTTDTYDSSPSEFYNSGLDFCDDCGPRIYTPPTREAIVSIPFSFKFNGYNEPLNAGFYQLEPVYKNEQPVLINLKQHGKTIGTITVIDFEKLSYCKQFTSAKVELINNEKMAQISLMDKTFVIHSLIERVDSKLK